MMKTASTFTQLLVFEVVRLGQAKAFFIACRSIVFLV
jgi:hypothetical protein